MILIDTNIWIYAYNHRSLQHTQARAWLESILTSGEIVAVPWPVIVGFVRIAGLGPLKFAPAVLQGILDNFFTILHNEMVIILEPSTGFINTYKQFTTRNQAYGNLAPDAYLAALAIEHGAVIASNDNNFARFESDGLRWFNPLERYDGTVALAGQSILYDRTRKARQSKKQIVRGKK